jgi:hypothetical protein
MQEAEKLLYKHLLLYDKYKDQPTIELGLPEIPWDELINNTADVSIGHSFITNLL